LVNRGKAKNRLLPGSRESIERSRLHFDCHQIPLNHRIDRGSRLTKRFFVPMCVRLCVTLDDAENGRRGCSGFFLDFDVGEFGSCDGLRR
jgi:hypothetical protein